jgi:hypothetical protein
MAVVFLTELDYRESRRIKEMNLEARGRRKKIFNSK